MNYIMLYTYFDTATEDAHDHIALSFRRFNQSLRCVHDLIAVCEDQTRARRGEYNLYYRLCQGNFDGKRASLFFF